MTRVAVSLRASSNSPSFLRYIWQCEECGEIFGGPRHSHRHAEGEAGIGHYYAVRRLTVDVVAVHRVGWNGSRYTYRKQAAA